MAGERDGEREASHSAPQAATGTVDEGPVFGPPTPSVFDFVIAGGTDAQIADALGSVSESEREELLQQVLLRMSNAEREAQPAADRVSRPSLLDVEPAAQLGDVQIGDRRRTAVFAYNRGDQPMWFTSMNVTGSAGFSATLGRRAQAPPN